MFHLQEGSNVYYCVLEGSRYQFADERDKMHLINVVSECVSRDHWQIYAFCILDSRACFVLETPKIQGAIRTLQEAIAELFGELRSTSMCVLTRQEQRLESLSDIAKCCREIHRFPIQEGYCSRIEDYWWSSYQSYIGTYEWKLLDLSLMELFFSVNPIRARQKVKRYHTCV